jgi:hypothetical protein
VYDITDEPVINIEPNVAHLGNGHFRYFTRDRLFGFLAGWIREKRVWVQSNGRWRCALGIDHFLRGYLLKLALERAGSLNS